VPASKSPRILIARLSAIGDSVHTLPVLCALRDFYPNAFLAWVTSPAAANVIEGHDCLDKTIVVERRWMKSPKQILEVRQELRQYDFDTAIDPQSLTKSSFAAWLSGARRRIGFAGKHGREFSRVLNNRLVFARQPHVVRRYLELLRPLGITQPSIRFEVPGDPTAEANAAEIVFGSHLRCGFALINAGAGWNSKLWPADRYGHVARYLGETHEMPSLVVWAGDEEREAAETIVAASGGHATLAPATTIKDLTALCRRATFLLGSDTGPLHIAAAVGTLCVGLYGATLPEVCGPFGDQHEVLRGGPGIGAERHWKRGGQEAMLAIEVESVNAACTRVIKRSGYVTAAQRAA
jgi:heptosyltransferase-1